MGRSHREELRNKGLAKVKWLTWEMTAKQVVEVYEKATLGERLCTGKNSKGKK